MTAIQEAKATLARLKGHVTRATKAFEKEILEHDVAGVAKAKANVFHRLEKLEEHVMIMEELKDMNVDLIQNEYAGIEAVQDKTRKEFSEYMNQVSGTNNEGANVDEPIGNQRVNNTSPNKSMIKKPPELEGDVSLKDFEAWRRKFIDYVVLSEMDKCDHDVQVATLRGFLSTEMYNKTKFTMGVEDETGLTIGEILEKIKRFIRAKRNIALDRVEFEQVAQREGEEFDDFYVSLQQIAENAELCGGHCEDCSKKC